MKAAAVVLSVILAASAGFWWRERVLERRLEAVAADVAGRGATVECQGLAANLVDLQSRTGSVRYGSDEIFLARSTCTALRRFVKDDHGGLACLRSIDYDHVSERDYACLQHATDAMTGVGTLAHEAYHVAGIANEATTECFAIQAAAYTATRLGAEADVAEALARMQLAFMRHKPPQYFSSECRRGGALDLHPETEAFPTESVARPPLLNWRVAIAGSRQ